MHYYDTQNSRQENFAYIRAGASALVLSFSLCRGLKSQHKCNSREISGNTFGTRFKAVMVTIVHNTNNENRQSYFP